MGNSESGEQWPLGFRYIPLSDEKNPKHGAPGLTFLLGCVEFHSRAREVVQMRVCEGKREKYGDQNTGILNPSPL